MTIDLDEARRPRGTKHDPAALTPAQRQLGRHLADVHDGYRQEMRQVQDALDQVAAGALDAAALRSMINRLTMRQNYWTLGAFCTTFCRLLTVHHTLEDEAMFPAILKRDDSLEPVIEKLKEEHEVIAALLTRLDEACVELVAGDTGLDRVRAEAERLSAVLSSHFAYEEEELVEPIGRLDVRI
ncbi:hemerythrin domain-containing protein [Nonomuraea sp. NEAU-A123]|uniref:hemerythrin domain-containing protein n=1 Tax=Nonomuraea sp. NEAU-A123 TaxID=2839649 RepID=UPI001BE4E06A|nr:hemerythrin domain-containing protein [Nonomuraea sp. NEAU-A123]MBT2233757.1 hemerythrin domain-containing protein [Nonomuraea sp. NEAU-A123]